MKGKWSSGKTAAVIIGSICGGIAMLAVFCIDVFRLSRVIFSYENENYAQGRYGNEGPSGDADSRHSGNSGGAGSRGYDDYGNYGGYDDYGNYDGYGDYDDYGNYDGYGGYNGYGNHDGYGSYGYGSDYGDDYSYGADSEYYEFHDAIREDLSYQVEFEYYDEEFGVGNVRAVTTYPVIYGKGETGVDFSGINSAIQKETEDIREYAAAISEEIVEESYFSFVTDSYVTYMDEEILSIIYVEHGYLDDETYESYVVSINVDMKSGLVMTNSQILDIDDAFAIEFRNRNERQNGEVAGLSMLSDQEITNMLTDDDSLIIFYTPMGMEVGFNYYYGWVTVTYRDYEKYKSHF
ncbi:MAG: hypothetical protein NC400_03125 [Clostridium sp.]|nr:hypothetical protein [Clostridium sp.]